MSVTVSARTAFPGAIIQTIKPMSTIPNNTILKQISCFDFLFIKSYISLIIKNSIKKVEQELVPEIITAIKTDAMAETPPPRF